ncbi:MAG TPA: hypothetical protein EYP03_01190 [Aquificae bacterium]|nr:hypothetical protein [Aquificota bacterium]
MRKILAIFLLIMFKTAPSFGATLSEYAEKLKTLVLKRKYKEAYRLLKQIEKKYPAIKTYIEHVIYLPKDDYALVVDKKNEKLYVIAQRKGFPIIVKIYPCITGKRPGDKLKEGDQRTPEGVYYPIKYIPKRNLAPIYGIGAYVLNYPNYLDKRLGKGGHGIWIHGTNDPNRPPHSSNGCIVLKNKYLKELKRYIKLFETPVVIVDGVKKEAPKNLLKERKELLEFLLNWKKAWENSIKDINTYFSFYSKNLITPYGDYEKWKKYKLRITRKKTWIKISLDDIQILKDGRFNLFGYKNIYAISFLQHYRSNNYNSTDRKVLYIVNENGKWKILAEEILLENK